MLETNIDDLNPEIYAYVMEKLFAEGALDVFLAPIQMKKNRPGTQFNVLCDERDTAKLREILFVETSTLGIREINIRRHSLERNHQNVETPWGAVNIKVAHLPNGELKVAPEYEDCRRLAQQHDIPLIKVYNTIIKAALPDL